MDFATLDGNLASGTDVSDGGGGLYIDSGGGVQIEDCTFWGNSAYANGGGIDYDGVSYFEVSFITVAENYASGSGGGLWAGPHAGTTVVGANLFAYNVAGLGSGAGSDVFGDMTFYNGINLVTDAGGISNMPASWVVADPLLGPLGFNGGPTKTAAPGAGSPAIGLQPQCSGTDQRGFPRKQPPAACTVGAYEVP
jgi:hypothetical protein